MSPFRLVHHRARTARPVAAVGTRRRPPAWERVEPRLLFAAATGTATAVATASSDVTTFHDDVGRTGADLAETQLTPSTVKVGSFGLQRSLAVDGEVYAQPLYMNDMTIGGASHNVVYVATEHDDVYAFDADTGAQLWYRSFIDPAAGINTVTSDEVGVDDIYPEIGITGTPVVDPATNAMYLVTKQSTTAADGTVTYQQYVRSVSLTTGQDTAGGSALIQSNLSGSGAGYTGTDAETVPFDALTENQRPALLLQGNDVYVGYASHGDNDPYHGWLFGFNTATLATDSAIDLSPDGLRAPIWMSGDGPSADAAGDIFVVTGNGTFDANDLGSDYGESVLRLDAAPGFTGHGVQGIKINDYFSPDDQAYFNYTDQDLGSSGLMLIPGTREGLTAGKDGNVYVVNTRHLGKFNVHANHIVQTDTTALGGGEAFFAPAYLNGTVYFAPSMGKLEGFKLRGGKLTAKAVGASPETYGFGASPTVSADGTAGGVVWAIQRELPAGARAGSGMPLGYTVLNAYNATTMAELYTSATDPAGGGTTTPPAVKFATPTVANGHVFVAADGAVLEYGLLTTAAAAPTATAAAVRRAAAVPPSPAPAKAAKSAAAATAQADLTVSAPAMARPVTTGAATSTAATFATGPRTIAAAAAATAGDGFDGLRSAVASPLLS